MSDVLEALLSAHVQCELARWRGAALARTVEVEVSSLFRWLREIKLDHVSSREQIMGVIERYVIELRIGGGVAELAGEMSRLVLSSPTSAETRVSHILPESSYDEFAAKVVALDGVWRELLTLISESAAFAEISTRVVSRALTELLLEAATPPESHSRLPSFAAKLAARLVPRLAELLARAVSRHLEQHRERFVSESEKHLLELLDAERRRSVLDDIWDAVSGMRLADAFKLLDAQDLEDFVVLGYEFWFKYRKTDYFRKISAELVDHFFTKYGQESLAALIEDMGVTEQIVVHELITFLGPMVEHAAQTGALEARIRAQLASFYRSPAARAALEAAQRSEG